MIAWNIFELTDEVFISNFSVLHVHLLPFSIILINLLVDLCQLILRAIPYHYEIASIDNVLFFDSKEVPNHSSDDFDESSHQGHDARIGKLAGN